MNIYKFSSSTLVLLFVFIAGSGYGQEEQRGLLSGLETRTGLDLSLEMNLQGTAATEAELPFWMYRNKRGRISEETNFAGWISGSAAYQLSENAFLEGGAGVLYQDQADKLQLDELYVGFHNSWLSAVVGRKQKAELYNGLSASNENILWSLNARPLPGIQLSTARPIFVFPKAGIGFEASLEEYLMEEDRFVSNARLHHKSFHLIYQPVSDFQIKAGLQHFVQWGGNSARYGQQPDGFDDYLRIFTGQGGGEGAPLGDQQNALGNNLGSYEVYLNSRIKDYRFSLFWNHLFEDGSGRRLGNTPDGRYGLFVEDINKDYWVQSFIYEFYYTKHQSHTTSGNHKFDNYFNNGTYNSGWTYEDRVLGVPFFLTNPNGRGIISNRFMAHHLGLGGVAFDGLPFKFMTSYRKNYGTNAGGLYPETQNILSSFLDVQVLQSTVQLNLQLGADFSSDAASNFGAGVRLSYGF